MCVYVRAACVANKDINTACVWMDSCRCGTFITDVCVCVHLCIQVDELYEAFCIQSRLREGASRMKQAFSSSPSTKGTKESIAEVNRRYKEYTEVQSQNIHNSVWGMLEKIC